jgi:hypothetical protein
MSGDRTWALDVADNASCGIVHELHAHLGNTTTGACAGLECFLNCCLTRFVVLIRRGCTYRYVRELENNVSIKINAKHVPAHTAGHLDELDGDLCGIHVCGLDPLATVSFPAGPFPRTLD